MTTYQYNGDVDLEYGGYFASTSRDERRYGYVSVVRVTPCSDAGGPDNLFWVEELTVNLPDADAVIAAVLHVIGQDLATWKAYKPAARRAILIDACIAYGKYDRESSIIVQIGPDDKFWSGSDEFRVDRKIRANWKLRNWVKTNYLKG